MPKVRLSEMEEKSRLVQGMILKNQAMMKLSDEEVAKKIAITKRTYQNKKNNPSTFKLGELWRTCKVLHFTEDEKQKIL